MSEETLYKCDVTGATIDERDAVPVTVLTVATEPFGQSTELELRTNENVGNAEHVSRDLLGAWLKDDEIDRMEVIVVGDSVVGWRDGGPYNPGEVQTATDEEAEILESLTYIGDDSDEPEVV